MSKGKERECRANQETRRKLQANLGLKDCFEGNLKYLSLVIRT